MLFCQPGALTPQLNEHNIYLLPFLVFSVVLQAC